MGISQVNVQILRQKKIIDTANTAIHELERAQKLRKGEDVLPTLTVDVNQMGSFGETDKNL